MLCVIGDVGQRKVHARTSFLQSVDCRVLFGPQRKLKRVSLLAEKVYYLQ